MLYICIYIFIVFFCIFLSLHHVHEFLLCFFFRPALTTRVLLKNRGIKTKDSLLQLEWCLSHRCSAAEGARGLSFGHVWRSIGID